MAVRLREADSMAAMAELRQKIAELEIQVSVLFILKETLVTGAVSASVC